MWKGVNLSCPVQITGRKKFCEQMETRNYLKILYMYLLIFFYQQGPSPLHIVANMTHLGLLFCFPKRAVTAHSNKILCNKF